MQLLVICRSHISPAEGVGGHADLSGQGSGVGEVKEGVVEVGVAL